jgi:hypothetical protein
MIDKRVTSPIPGIVYDDSQQRITILASHFLELSQEDQDDHGRALYPPRITKDVQIPAKFEVCDVCRGTGSHVNPSIDSHGLSSEDFDEDPDFRADYLSGVYDVTCRSCAGTRVTLVVDRDRATTEQLALFDDIWWDHTESERDDAYIHSQECWYEK